MPTLREQEAGVAPGHTLPGTVMGTPAYMSPEQARGDGVDARTDQYALGCILFELLTGQDVFTANNVSALLYKHITAPVPSLRERAPQRRIPKGLDALVQRALAKQREERFGSLRELETALQEQIDLLLQQRGQTRSRTGLSPLPAPKRWLRWVLASLCVGLLAGGYLGYRAVVQRAARGHALSEETLRQLRQQALAVLQTDLHDGDPVLRRKAVAALGQTRDGALVDAVLPLLQDQNAQVQAQAAESLGQLGANKALAALHQAAENSAVAAVRVAAAGALDQLADESGRSLLRQLLHDKSPDTRLRAAYLLCTREEPEALAMLTALVERSRLPDDVALSLLARLAQSGQPKASQQLIERLRGSGPPELQIAAAAQLVRLGEEPGRQFLREQARLPGPSQLPAARAMAELDEPVQPELFRQIVRTAQGSLDAQLEAVAGLGASGEEADLPLLAGLLLPATAKALRQAAAVAMLRIAERDPRVIAQRSLQWARTAAADESWLVREAAVAALGDIDLAEAVPLLSARLRDDPEPQVRLRAARAIGRRQSEAALEALCRSLSDSDSGVRLESLRSLSRVGQTMSKEGVGGILARLGDCFRLILASGSAQEQILARTTLLRLGDSSQRDALRPLQSSPDAAVRRFLIEHGASDPELLRHGLADAVFAVRFAASQRLAEAGDRAGLAVLNEALAQGGSAGVLAYGLLRQLGVAAPSPADLESLLKSDNVGQRLATVEAIGRMPVALAVPLLRVAARDPERLVRRLVAEVTADLKEGPSGHPGEAVLRLLAADRDLSVSTRAATLLLRLRRALETAATSAKPPKTAAAAATAAAGSPDNAASSASPSPPAPAADAGAPDAAAAAPPSDTPSSPSGSAELDPAVEQLSRDGLRALAAGDTGRALQLFERARTRCAKARDNRAVCSPRITELSFQLARALESQGQLAEALTEYQKVARATGAAKAKGEQRSRALEAVIRLSPRLGRLIITQIVKGKCKEQEQLLPPGSQMVNIGGQLKAVKLRAGETVTLETCKLSARSKTH